MAILIKCIGFPDGRECHVDGDYLKQYDPEAFDGRGWAVWTPIIAEAIHFTDVEAAMTLWRTTSRTIPTRTDGKPNRPLTAFSIQIERIDAR